MTTVVAKVEHDDKDDIPKPENKQNNVIQQNIVKRRPEIALGAQQGKVDGTEYRKK